MNTTTISADGIHVRGMYQGDCAGGLGGWMNWVYPYSYNYHGGGMWAFINTNDVNQVYRQEV